MNYKIETKQLKKTIDKLNKNLNREILNSTKRSLRAIGKSDIKKLKDEQLSGGGGLNVKSKALKKSFKYKLYGRNLNDLELSSWTGWKAAAIFQTGGTVNAKNKLLPVFFSGNRMSRKEYREAFRSKKFVIVKAKTGKLMIFDTQSDQFVGTLQAQIIQKKRLRFFENHENNQNEHANILDREFQKGMEKLITKD